MRSHCSYRVLRGLLILVAWDAAAAEPEAANQRASLKLEQGVARYDRRDYGGALRDFQDAYEIVPSPKIHFNLGLALDGLGRRGEAMEAFGRFLREAPDAAAEKRAQAERLVRGLRARVGALEITTDLPGAEVLIDGHSRGRTPLPGPVYLDPGGHGLTVSAAELARPHREEVFVEAAATLRVSLKLRPSGATASVATSPLTTYGVTRPGPQRDATPIYKRWWLWTAVAAVAAAAAIALATLPPDLPKGTDGTIDKRGK